MQRLRRSQAGFSLVEMMMVLFILTIVMAVVFNAISEVQKRYKTEEGRLDTLQNAREFIDLMSRDIHNSGYPNNHMYAADRATAASDADNLVSVGLYAASQTEIIIEGDMGGATSATPTVSIIRYRLKDDGKGNCPCTIQRTTTNKPGGSTQPESAGTSYSGEVENVVNSVGGASPYPITGTTPTGAKNDDVYAGLKSEPIFRFYDAKGNEVSGVPADLSSATNVAAAKTAAQSTTVIAVAVNVLAPVADLNTGRRPVAELKTTVRLPNR